MRVRFILHDAYAMGGGVLTVTFHLAQDLSADHDVEVVSVLRSKDEPINRVPAGVRLRPLVDIRPDGRARGPRGWAKALVLKLPSVILDRHDDRRVDHNPLTDWRLRRYLRHVEADAVVGMQPGISLAIARYGRPDYVRVVQDHRPFRSRPKGMQDAYRRLASQLDAFLTLTERDAQHVRRAIGDLVPVRAMPNGCPEYTGSPPDYANKVVVAAGRLKHGKGFDRLVAAWAQVAERHPDWQLQIFGEGERRPDIEQLIAERDLGGSVTLMGFSTRLMEDIAAAGSLFVLSSRREGHPMALLEAMACGLPVVSFDCPYGPREMMGVKGRYGTLVPNHDVDALASAIMQLIEAGPDRRRELGTAARARGYEHRREAVARRWAKLLRDEHRRKQAAVGRGSVGRGSVETGRQDGVSAVSPTPSDTESRPITR